MRFDDCRLPDNGVGGVGRRSTRNAPELVLQLDVVEPVELVGERGAAVPVAMPVLCFYAVSIDVGTISLFDLCRVVAVDGDSANKVHSLPACCNSCIFSKTLSIKSFD
jgi:hypothetical protein